MPERANSTARPLSASQEDYLEAIYHLVRDGRAARTSDIADRLRVRRSSVTGAVRTLAARGLVEHSAYGLTSLTRRGLAAARGVAGRHRSLREFLESILGLPPDQAERTACVMEHGAPPELPQRLATVTRILRARPGLLRSIRAPGPARRARA
jgi:DtxR family Mn-dependent transcriptional regulator